MDPEALGRELDVSEGNRESADDWWNRAHERGHTYWLSGTPGQEVWERLAVLNRLVAGARVLNVGVGLGHCTRSLAERGCKVSALDISPVALKNVADVTVKGYLASNLEDLPSNTFDTALSHLVAQHMTDLDLEAQIRHVVRALRPDGVFAVQYAADAHGHTYDQAVLHHVKSGSIRRTQAHFDALVEDAGGLVEHTYRRETHEGGIIWLVAHIVRPAPERSGWRWPWSRQA
jgi:2-polyprenyl-3-methyl-5-hydroxy-6-metoxy-1,4-benzoquinol methylase